MIAHRTIGSLVVAAALLPLFTACGFQLRGHRPMPEVFKATYVESPDDQTDFVQDLRKLLLTSGSRLTPTRAQASAVVEILADKVTARVLSVSARNLPREYELTHTVRFEVRAGEAELLAAQEISGTRTYSFDETKLLAKENEEAILRRALAGDLASIVMRRLSSL